MAECCRPQATYLITMLKLQVRGVSMKSGRLNFPAPLS